MKKLAFLLTMLCVVAGATLWATNGIASRSTVFTPNPDAWYRLTVVGGGEARAGRVWQVCGTDFSALPDGHNAKEGRLWTFPADTPQNDSQLFKFIEGTDGKYAIQSYDGRYLSHNQAAETTGQPGARFDFQTTPDYGFTLADNVVAENGTNQAKIWIDSEKFLNFAAAGQKFAVNYYINDATAENAHLFTFTEIAVAENNLPFKTTTITGNEFPADAHWYLLTVRNYKYWQAVPGEDKISLVNTCVNLSGIPDNMLWCFSGDDENGFSIYNKAAGVNKPMYAASDANEAVVSFGEGAKWKLGQSSSTEIPGSYHIYLSTGTGDNNVNDYGNAGQLKFWASSASKGDVGSAVKFISADEIAPAEFTTVSNGTFAENTQWYRIKVDGRFLSSDIKIAGNYNGFTLNPVSPTPYTEEMWCFTRGANNTVKIWNKTDATKVLGTGNSTNTNLRELVSPDSDAALTDWQVYYNPNGTIYLCNNAGGFIQNYGGADINTLGVWKEAGSTSVVNFIAVADNEIAESNPYAVNVSPTDKTNSERYTTAINFGSQVIGGLQTAANANGANDGNQIYFDKTSMSVSARQGETVNLKYIFEGHDMYMIMYIDGDDNGFTAADKICSHYKRDSNASGQPGDDVVIPATIPEGLHRIRFKIDWDETGGTPAGIKDQLLTHGGLIVDAFINILPPLPFEPTTIADGQFANGTKWYRMQIRPIESTPDGRTISVDGMTGGNLKCYSNHNSSTNNDDFWCFVANGNGFNMYNRTQGASVALTKDDNDYVSFTNEGTVWEFTKFTAALHNNRTNGWLIKASGTDAYLHNHGGGDNPGDVRAWTSSWAATDPGSAIVFLEAQTESTGPSSIVIDDANVAGYAWSAGDNTESADSRNWTGTVSGVPVSINFDAVTSNTASDKNFGAIDTENGKKGFIIRGKYTLELPEQYKIKTAKITFKRKAGGYPTLQFPLNIAKDPNASSTNPTQEGTESTYRAYKSTGDTNDETWASFTWDTPVSSFEFDTENSHKDIVIKSIELTLDNGNMEKHTMMFTTRNQGAPNTGSQSNWVTAIDDEHPVALTITASDGGAVNHNTRTDNATGGNNQNTPRLAFKSGGKYTFTVPEGCYITRLKMRVIVERSDATWAFTGKESITLNGTVAEHTFNYNKGDEVSFTVTGQDWGMIYSMEIDVMAPAVEDAPANDDPEGDFISPWITIHLRDSNGQIINATSGNVKTILRNTNVNGAMSYAPQADSEEWKISGNKEDGYMFVSRAFPGKYLATEKADGAEKTCKLMTLAELEANTNYTGVWDFEDTDNPAYLAIRARGKEGSYPYLNPRGDNADLKFWFDPNETGNKARFLTANGVYDPRETVENYYFEEAMNNQPWSAFLLEKYRAEAEQAANDGDADRALQIRRKGFDEAEAEIAKKAAGEDVIIYRPGKKRYLDGTAPINVPGGYYPQLPETGKWTLKPVEDAAPAARAAASPRFRLLNGNGQYAATLPGSETEGTLTDDAAQALAVSIRINDNGTVSFVTADQAASDAYPTWVIGPWQGRTVEPKRSMLNQDGQRTRLYYIINMAKLEGDDYGGRGKRSYLTAMGNANGAAMELYRDPQPASFWTIEENINGNCLINNAFYHEVHVGDGNTVSTERGEGIRWIVKNHLTGAAADYGLYISSLPDTRTEGTYCLEADPTTDSKQNEGNNRTNGLRKDITNSNGEVVTIFTSDLMGGSFSPRSNSYKYTAWVFIPVTEKMELDLLRRGHLANAAKAMEMVEYLDGANPWCKEAFDEARALFDNPCDGGEAYTPTTLRQIHDQTHKLKDDFTAQVYDDLHGKQFELFSVSHLRSIYGTGTFMPTAKVGVMEDGATLGIVNRAKEERDAMTFIPSNEAGWYYIVNGEGKFLNSSGNRKFVSDERQAGKYIVELHYDGNFDNYWTCIKQKNGKYLKIAVPASSSDLTPVTEHANGDNVATGFEFINWNPDVTGIDGITTEVAAFEGMYNLQGVRVDPRNATPGVYLVRKGGKSLKVLVR